MKAVWRCLTCLVPIIVVSVIARTITSAEAQNLLADPGFESGTPVASGLGGWGELNGAAFSQDYAHGGLWSLKDTYNSAAVGPAVGGLQIVTATAGTVYGLSGWGLTPATLNGGQGLLLVDFLDSSQNLINSGGTVFYPIGSLGAATPAQTWTFLSGSVTAPVNTAYIEVSAELFNGSPGNVVYYDDLALTVVPEPSAMAVLSTGLGLLLTRSMRRRAS